MRCGSIGTILFALISAATLGQSVSVTAAEILHGEGWGKSRERACQQALASLAESLKVEVRSEFRIQSKATRKDGGERDVDTSTEQDIQTRSDLPILGANQSVRTNDGEFVCETRLDPNRATRYYRKRLNTLRKEAVKLEGELEAITADDEKRHQLLSDLLTLNERYSRFALVARFLDLEVPALSTQSRASIRAELEAIEQQAPSLMVAASRLIRNLPDELIHLTPPHPVESREVTPFARALESEISARIRTTDSPDSASLRMRGEYEVSEGGLVVTYRLLDENDVIRDVKTVTLQPASYDHLRVRPQSVDFDRLLHQGLAVESGFRASLATKQGQEDLLFRSGEKVELLVRLNQPGYFYLVGHTINNGESYSYLVPLQDGRGARSFVRYVNAEQANKWISLGAFEVSAPFGVESTQVIASTEDLVSEIPGYKYDQKTGLFVLAENAEAGVRKTRALKPVSTQKVESTEAVLMFTTAPDS